MTAMAASGVAFDTQALDYDASFSNSRLGRTLRDCVHEVLAETFTAGSRVLDMGCGTGEDALRLSARGIRVIGIDSSLEMIVRARQKADHGSGADTPVFERADLNEDPLPPGPFDGVLANFGVLNCVHDRRSLAGRLADAVRPGGRAVVVVIGRFCPWEWLWYLAHARPDAAFRRLSGAAVFNGMRITYPTARQLSREFAPAFVVRRRMGIGLLLPPTYASGVIERHPRAGRWLAAAERQIRHSRAAVTLSDHYLVEMERV